MAPKHLSIQKKIKENMKTYHSWRDKIEGKNFTKLQMENCRYT